MPGREVDPPNPAKLRTINCNQTRRGGNFLCALCSQAPFATWHKVADFMVCRKTVWKLLKIWVVSQVNFSQKDCNIRGYRELISPAEAEVMVIRLAKICLGLLWAFEMLHQPASQRGVSRSVHSINYCSPANWVHSFYSSINAFFSLLIRLKLPLDVRESQHSAAPWLDSLVEH